VTARAWRDGRLLRRRLRVCGHAIGRARCAGGWTVLSLAVIVVLTAVLDAWSLAARSIWIDEGVSLQAAHFDRDEFLHFITREEMNMAFYHLLLRVWIRLGDDEVTVRSLSLLAALATLPAIYVLARRLFSPRVGLLSALFLGLNPMHYSYARETRAYALTLLLVVLGSYLFLRATSEGRVREWIAYVLVMTLAVYSHFFAIFVIVAHGGYLLLRRDSRLRPAVLSFAALAVLLVPILAYIAFGGQAGRVTAGTPTIRDILFVAPSLTGREAFFFYAPAAFVALIAARGRPPFSPTNAESYRFLLLWLAMPVALALAVTVAGKPILVSRYLLVCLPALVILVAAAISELRRTWLFVAVAGAATVLAAWTVLSCHPGCRTEIEDWRGVERLVRAEWRPGDQISFDPHYMVIPFNYYAGSGEFARRRSSSPPGYPTLADPPMHRPKHRHWIVVDDQDPKRRGAAPAKQLLGGHDSWSFADDLVVLRSRTE
jgi:mannosyltransferase